jgi:hypothetical protein
MARLPRRGLDRSRYHLRRIERILKRPEVKERAWEDYEDLLRKHRAMQGTPDSWVTSRGESEYETLFAEKGLKPLGLGGSITEAIKNIPVDGHPLVIHEYGPGKGYALQDLSNRLRRAGLPVESVAIDAFIRPELRGARESGGITQIVASPAERFMPEKEAHVILDVLGPFNYMVPELRPDHFLKTLHSLAPGGIMMAGFNVAPLQTAKASPMMERALTGGLFGKHKTLPSLTLHNRMHDDMYRVERYLKRKGFDAKFFRVGGGGEFPHWGLVVHRPVKR